MRAKNSMKMKEYEMQPKQVMYRRIQRKGDEQFKILNAKRQGKIILSTEE